MKVLILDSDAEGLGIDLALRAQEADHEVRYWLPRRVGTGEALPYGDGLVEKPEDFEPSMDWADLIVRIGNATYEAELAPYFGRGYKIFGSNAQAAALELDRARGQEVLEQCGVETLPYEIATSAEDAIAVICREGKPYVLKPWGGHAHKEMTCVPASCDEAIYTLEKWEREGTFKGELMLQEKVDGVEMGIAGWFGPGGWSALLEESFEHKKFLNDDLGCNTGEMGTVIRHVRKSKLFDLILEPLTDYLHAINYVGDCSVNCIITDDGDPKPLEFTMRLGFPDFNIRQEVFRGDPVVWMLELLEGHDTLVASKAVAVGVVMTHGDFPKSQDAPSVWSEAPIYGINEETRPHLHFQQVMSGAAPVLVDGELTRPEMLLTAGTYVLVASGAGASVSDAADAAYQTAWNVSWPGNVMFRTDIGKRLKADLPRIQKHGYAVGMEY